MFSLCSLPPQKYVVLKKNIILGGWVDVEHWDQIGGVLKALHGEIKFSEVVPQCGRGDTKATTNKWR